MTINQAFAAFLAFKGAVSILCAWALLADMGVL